MKFMITFNHTDGVWDRLSPEEQEGHGKWLESFTAELAAEKNSSLVFMSPPDQRKTVRKHESGELEVTSGPAIPGPEQVGGYYIIDADSVEEAIEWAKKGRWLVGANEVRQLFGLPS